MTAADRSALTESALTESAGSRTRRGYRAVGVAFYLLARARRRRVFHPSGALFTGQVKVTDDSLPVAPGTTVMRMSKGLGTPGGLPDIVGIAVRLPTRLARQWDILLTGPIRRVGPIALPSLAFGWTGNMMSSLQPYVWHGSTWWLRARISGSERHQPHGRLSTAALVSALREGDAKVVVEARRDRGEFVPLVVVTDLTPYIGPDVSFDPTANLPTAIALSPGWLSRLRTYAYAGSRAGRHATIDSRR